MADATQPAYSWTQGIAQLLGGGNQNQTTQNQLVQALLAQKAQQTGGVSPQANPASTPNTGTYEGNIPTAANQYSNGQYGMPSSGTSSSAAAVPTNPFTQGAAPTPYLNGPFSNPPMDPTMAAIFSQAPG